MDRRHKEGFWLTILQVNHLFLVDHCKVHGRDVEVLIIKQWQGSHLD